MNIKVSTHTIEIDNKTIINSGEYNVNKCTFEFSEEYSTLTKMAIFTTCESSYKTSILNNECIIPGEVLESEGSVLLGVYGYETADDELVLRYSPTPQRFVVQSGSYREGNDPELPEPTEWEHVLELINEAITETNNLNLVADKDGNITKITITKKDGTSYDVEVLDGVSLEDIEINNRNLLVTYGGDTDNLGQVVPNIQVGTTTTGNPGTSASVVNVGTDLNPILEFTIPKGEAGAIKFEIVEQLPTTEIKEDTIYLVPYQKIIIQTLPTENIQLHTIYIVESTGKRYVYNGNEWVEISSDNQYIEYIYINNQWEELGSIGVDINLDDYYTKSETNNLLDTKQPLIDSTHKLSSDLVDDTGHTNKFVTSSDITNWNGKVSPTDYATSSTGGVVKIDQNYGLRVSSGTLVGYGVNYTDYQSALPQLVVDKGTLENVITGKNLETANNKVVSISSSSTDTQYPSAKCVYDIVGDIETILTTLDIGGGV